MQLHFKGVCDASRLVSCPEIVKLCSSLVQLESRSQCFLLPCRAAHNLPPLSSLVITVSVGRKKKRAQSS